MFQFIVLVKRHVSTSIADCQFVFQIIQKKRKV